MTLRTGVSIAHIESEDQGVTVVLADAAGRQRIKGSHLLIATSRRPNIDGLGLDAVRIAHTATGVVVDRGLRTSNRRVYAVGDVTGGPQFTHAANYHAGLVIRNALFRIRVRVDERLLPRVTFTDPELTRVGISEKEARHAGRSFVCCAGP